MQRDHLLSAAGVSEQAGGRDGRAHVHAAAKTHTHTEEEACQHTCANRGVRRDLRLRSQQSRSSFFFPLLFFWGGFLIQSVCQTRRKSGDAG